MENKIYLGKITSTHGIKGELKIKSDFEKKEKVFKNEFIIYINDENHKITSYRSHKGFDMITIDGIYDINEIYKYVSSDVYINRNDLNLKEDEYLLNELIGFDVFDGEVILGKVNDILYSPAHNLIHVVGYNNFYIPFIENYIDHIDVKNKKIVTNNGKDLII